MNTVQVVPSQCSGGSCLLGPLRLGGRLACRSHGHKSRLSRRRRDWPRRAAAAAAVAVRLESESGGGDPRTVTVWPGSGPETTDDLAARAAGQCARDAATGQPRWPGPQLSGSSGAAAGRPRAGRMPAWRPPGPPPLTRIKLAV